MLSKIVNFFIRRDKKSKYKTRFLVVDKNYEIKSMEWQDDDGDRTSNDSSSWIEKEIFQRSKSDISITAIRNHNCYSQGTQISSMTFNTPKNIKSTLENLTLNDDHSIEEDGNNTLKSYSFSNQFNDNSYYLGIKTLDRTTKEIVFQQPEILNFQGNTHSSAEIAFEWKKDCRTWLWKSRRFAQDRKS